MKRVLVVGGVAGGASAAARIRRLDESANITVFERGPHVSFSNCALPYHLSGVIARSEQLVLMSPEKFKKQYNIDVRTENEVTAIDRAAKTVTVKKLADGTEYTESYDVLVLSPGASPIVPRSIGGTDQAHVFTVRNVVDIAALKSYIDTNNVEDVAVIGGGFIGLEVAENLVEAGKKVSLVEAADQVMAPFDYDMVQILHKEMMDHGIDLVVGDGLKEIQADKVVLNSGKELKAGAVVLAIGVAPETALAKAAGLEIGVTGGIKVNQHYQTNDPSIYAVGDAIEVYHRLTRKPTRLALAGPAQRQARAAGDHIEGMNHNNRGVIGSCAVRVFGLNAAATGLNEKTAKAAGTPCDFVYIIPSDRPSLMPEARPMHFKLIYEVPTGRILGAQAIGQGNVDKLTAGRIEPDVCVLYTSSAQAFMLFAGWQHHQYEKLQFTFVGESTCADSWVHTFNTGKPGFAIPSFADRKFGAVGEWEVRVTFTPADLVRALDGLEGMYKSGLRYPIGSCSLTTDIIAGLPPHYMDY